MAEPPNSSPSALSSFRPMCWSRSSIRVRCAHIRHKYGIGAQTEAGRAQDSESIRNIRVARIQSRGESISGIQQVHNRVSGKKTDKKSLILRTQKSSLWPHIYSRTKGNCCGRSSRTSSHRSSAKRPVRASRRPWRRSKYGTLSLK